MSESMTIDKAQAEIHALADRIQVAIQEFNQKTGLFVEHVNLMTTDHTPMSGKAKKVLCGVALEVSI